MKWMWCWRCKTEIPMLDEREYAHVYQLFGECMNTLKTKQEQGTLHEKVSLQERFHPVTTAYERITGVAGMHPNVVMHHRISLFGDPCKYCGKPLRTPRAAWCAGCWRKVEEESAGEVK